MAREEHLCRPKIALIKLHSYDIRVLPIKDVPHNSVEPRWSTWHFDSGTRVYALLELKTHAACRNILEIADPHCCPPSAVGPDEFHEIGTEKSLVSAALLRSVHIVLIGNSGPSYDEIYSRLVLDAEPNRIALQTLAALGVLFEYVLPA